VATTGIDDARSKLPHGGSAIAIACRKTDRRLLPHAALIKAPARQGKLNFAHDNFAGKCPL